MISVVLGVIGAILGLVIYYVRVMSVAIDVKSAVSKNIELSNRYKNMYRISEKLEKIWPTIEPVDHKSWAKKISNVSILLVFILLISAGVFQEYLTDYAGFILLLLFLLSSLSGGQDSISSYEKIKPYLPIIFPAAVYQGLTMLADDHPEVMDSLVLFDLDFMQTKILVTFTAFFLAFIIPKPLAKFDVFFSNLVAKSTLYFTKDLLRLGVSPRDSDEENYRKLAKETVAHTLKIILVVFGVVTYFTHTS